MFTDYFNIYSCWMTRDDVRPTMNECLRIIKSYELEYGNNEFKAILNK